MRIKPARGTRDPKTNGNGTAATDVVIKVVDGNPPAQTPPRTGNGTAKAAAKRDLARPRLGDVLMESELVSSEQVEHALAQQAESGKRLGEVFVDQGVVDERNLVEALARQLDLEIIDLRRVRPEADALAALPESVANTERGSGPHA